MQQPCFEVGFVFGDSENIMAEFLVHIVQYLHSKGSTVYMISIVTLSQYVLY